MYSCKSQEGVEVELLCFPGCPCALWPVPLGLSSSAGVWLSVAGTLLAVSDVRLLPGHRVAQGQHRNSLGRQGWLSAAAAAGLWGHGFLRLSCCFQLEVCQGNSYRYQITAKNLQALVLKQGVAWKMKIPGDGLAVSKGTNIFLIKYCVGMPCATCREKFMVNI